MTKPLTQWFNPNRRGTIISIGNLLFVDNLLNYIVDNTASHNSLVTTPLQSTKQPPTAWVQNS